MRVIFIAGPRLRCRHRLARLVAAAALVATSGCAGVREGEPVTVAGMLLGTDEIELDWVQYRDWHIDTDRLPVRLPAIH